MAGNADLTPLYSNATNPFMGCLLGCLFVFVLGLVLSNLLVSIMTHTLDKVGGCGLQHSMRPCQLGAAQVSTSGTLGTAAASLADSWSAGHVHRQLRQSSCLLPLPLLPPPG